VRYAASMALAHDAWVVDEPRPIAVAGYVLARALRSPRSVLAAALLAALAVTAARLALPASYRATLTFRLTEGALHAPQDLPRPPAQIREFVDEVALNRTALLKVMERHGLSAGLRQADAVAAVEAFREEIGVEVRQNEFLLGRDPDGPPRSALLALSDVAATPGQAQAIARDLGAAVLESQEATRWDWLLRAQALGAARVDQAQARLRQLSDRWSALAARAGAAPPEEAARLRLEAASLRRELEAALARAGAARRRTSGLDLAADVERRNLGLDVRMVDERLETLRAPASWPAAAAGAGLLLLAFLPLAGLLQGAFDDRILGPADVLACGLPLLGTVGAVGRAGEAPTP
jgi:hypothetical protein